MRSLARNVTNPRSPGPAPTRKTFPVLFLVAIASFGLLGGSRASSRGVKYMPLRRHFSRRARDCSIHLFIGSSPAIAQPDARHRGTLPQLCLRAVAPILSRKLARAI